MNGAELSAKGAEGLTALELARTKPDLSVSQCIIRISEMMEILRPLHFDNSEENYDYILKKVVDSGVVQIARSLFSYQLVDDFVTAVVQFIEEEVGAEAFRSMTFEIFITMGIRNSGNVAVSQ